MGLLIWEDFESWREPIRKFTTEIIDEKVINAVKDISEDICLDEFMDDWLTELQITTVDKFIKYEDILSELQEKFINHFSAVRCYHACRPQSTKSYYENGIKPLTRDRLATIVDSIILNKDYFPSCSKNDIDNILSKPKLCIEQRLGYSSYSIARDIAEHPENHYLREGSEIIQAIASHLQLKEEYQQLLENSYVPTIFICDIPTEFISTERILDLIKPLLIEIFLHIRYPDHNHNLNNDITIKISQTLPPKFIVKHYHPNINHFQS